MMTSTGSGKHKIYFADTTEIKLDEKSISVLLLNSGVHPDVPPEDIRLYGYREQITWPDGSVAPGVLEPICLWYIPTPTMKILVDTGISPENAAHANKVFRTRDQGQVYTTRPEHDIRKFLASHGTTPEEIDVVILTHLHLDHFANAPAYTNARFIVQRRELPWGLTPPPYAEFHWREFTPYLIDVLDRVEAVEGDVTICDGVEAWWVGGHTAGSQAVAVDTELGKVVLAGDFFYSYKNIEWNWPPGNYWSLDEWEQSSQRLRSDSDLIIPNHDYETFERYPRGYIG
ncbi:N-acyl homoserine lactonase family protein [Microbacterium soli]|uniref:Metallo-beta-lactamase domain-containing protein n=1 Tax=Microbacterium soli TaxID=446075 RepID=A0ABP7N548_9MICO